MSVSRFSAASAALALTGLATFGLQSPALAQQGPPDLCPNPGGQYPPGQCDPNNPGFQNRTSDDNLAPGQSAEVRSPGWQANSNGKKYVQSTPVFVGNFQANSAGLVVTRVTIPATMPLGEHHIVLQGVGANGQNRTVAIPIAVTSTGGAATGAPGRGAGGAGVGGVSLPRTGTEIAVVTAAGVALVGIGAAAVYAGRRRQTAA